MTPTPTPRRRAVPRRLLLVLAVLLVPLFLAVPTHLRQDALIGPLADRYHVIAPDYPGFGNSSMPAVDEFDYSFDSFARILDKLVVKKGSAGPPDQDPYQVDGLSGATLTSNGVTNMLRFWMGEQGFGPYLDKKRAEKGI